MKWSIILIVTSSVLSPLYAQDQQDNEENAMKNMFVKKIEQKKEVLPEKEQRAKVKKVFESRYKSSIELLKLNDAPRSKLLLCSNKYKSLANELFLEEETKTKKEWFVRMSKGFSVLLKCKLQIDNARSQHKKDLFEQSSKNYVTAKNRLIAIVKARKKEYALEK